MGLHIGYKCKCQQNLVNPSEAVDSWGAVGQGPGVVHRGGYSNLQLCQTTQQVRL